MYTLPKRLNEIRYRIYNSTECIATIPSITEAEALQQIPEALHTKITKTNKIIDYIVGTSERTGSYKQDLVLKLDDILALPNTTHQYIDYKIKAITLIANEASGVYFHMNWSIKLNELLAELEEAKCNISQ